jgi:hypothetical protein
MVHAGSDELNAILQGDGLRVGGGVLGARPEGDCTGENCSDTGHHGFISAARSCPPGVLEDPAHAGGVRPELGLTSLKAEAGSWMGTRGRGCAPSTCRSRPRR